MTLNKSSVRRSCSSDATGLGSNAGNAALHSLWRCLKNGLSSRGMLCCVTSLLFSAAAAADEAKPSAAYSSSNIQRAAPVAIEPPAPLDEWQAAYNSGDRKRMRDFAASVFTGPSFAPEELKSVVDGWILDRRRYGSVRYVVSEESGDGQIHWFRTDPTEVWLGIRIWRDAAKPARLTNFAVRRGSAPAMPKATAEAAPSETVVGRYLEALAAQDMYSGAVLVARGDQVLHAGGYGSASNGGPRNTTETRFNIASLGKMFTAVAVMQLVEDGALSLSDPLSKFVPEFPRAVSDRVTVNDLLLHTSGIELDEISEFNQRMLGVRSVSEILAAQLDHIDQVEVKPAPRKFDYTNEGFNLLGVIVERVTGKEYCDYLEDRIFRPAAMSRTSCDSSAAPVATGYMYVDNDPDAPRVSNAAHLPPRAYPAGAHYSTVYDLFRFHRALVEGRLLKPKTFKAATSAQILEAELPGVTYAYGYGFEVQTRGAVRMVGHSGGMEGVSARYEYYPDLDVLVVALSNYDTSAVIFASYMRDILAAKASRQAAEPH